MRAYDLVVMGASWGGLRAVDQVLHDLPAGFDVPVVVAQHRDPDSEDGLLARLLSRHTTLEVVDGADKTEIVPGRVLLAPTDYHLLVEDGCVELSVDAPVQYSRPSIDVLFESAAASYGSRVVAVLLTGANTDGADGMRQIAGRGGYTIVQDPETAERREMPDGALAAIRPDAVVPLDEVGATIAAVCEGRGRQ
jgi:two-component system chemotaxis response regulator CheB